jgi:membrane protein DedA with SNARE-associated domain
MLDALLDWLRHHESPLSYVVLGLAALIEYVFPPFPGDTVALFGVFLAVGAGYHASLVYVALNVGAIVGGQLAWAFGRAFADPSKRPRWLRGPRADRAIADLTARFAERGAAYLALNRFVPALRAFFFVAAGIAGLPFGRVLFFGALSAMLWNALLLALGWLVGASWERLSSLLGVYSWIVLALVLVALAIAWARGRASRS